MRRNLPILRPDLSDARTGPLGSTVDENGNLGSQPDPSHPSKRRRTDARISFARRRAVAACEPCRSRKTKCDNARPICGACASRSAACVFRDQQSDHSTFDSASLAILDRVNYAIQLLETGGATSATQDRASSIAESDVDDPCQKEDGQGQGEILPRDEDLGQQDGTSTAWSFRAQANTEAALHDALNITSGSSSTNILDWPVFESIQFQEENIKPAIKSSVLDLQHGRIHEGEVLGLVESFLRNVHTKNPVLDPIELLGLTRDVAEQGFGWDGASCLVLICSALGRIATPWNMATPTRHEHSQSDSSRLQMAEAYYTAARKRLGLLDTSITATQCCFLTGVYEMYAMRPLTSWSSFNRACTMLQLHLFAQPEGDGSFTRREQCLYWSALKSECEVREELALPPSGLALVGYPGGFPSPPGSSADTASIIDLGTPASFSSSQTVSWELLHEHSWYYYLSDIAYRRIANRATTMLYGRPKQEWMSMTVEALYRTCDELDKQTLQWWDNIPGSPSADLTAEADVDELTYMLWLNYVDLREKIWRPFLFLAVHANLSAQPDMNLSGQQGMLLVSENAAKCLDMCSQTLEGARLKHRHHGLWLTLRCMFSKALLLVAAARSEKLEVHMDWATRVKDFRDYLAYWEQEAPDCKGMREALEMLEHNNTMLPE